MIGDEDRSILQSLYIVAFFIELTLICSRNKLEKTCPHVFPKQTFFGSIHRKKAFFEEVIENNIQPPTKMSQKILDDPTLIWKCSMVLSSITRPRAKQPASPSVTLILRRYKKGHVRGLDKRHVHEGVVYPITEPMQASNSCHWL